MPAVEASSKNAHWHRPDRVKRCISCACEKPLSEFTAYAYATRQGKQSTRYESRCRACSSARRKARYAANPAHDNAVCRDWRERNRDHHLSLLKRYRESDEGRRAKAHHQRLRKARLRSGENDTPAIRAIYAEAMRVEALIQPCPVFDLPELGKKIHVDHRIPLARGGRHVASNLQLLPIGLNMRKGVSCPQ